MIAQAANGGGETGSIVFPEVKDCVAPYLPEWRYVIGHDGTTGECSFDRGNIERLVTRGCGVNGSPAIESTQLRFSLRTLQRNVHLVDGEFDVGTDGNAHVPRTLADYLPREIWLAPDGTEQPSGHGLRAAYVPAPFRFCLRCRVSYSQTRGQDFAKLATYAAEGRSSALSLVSTSVIRSQARGPWIVNR